MQQSYLILIQHVPLLKTLEDSGDVSAKEALIANVTSLYLFSEQHFLMYPSSAQALTMLGVMTPVN